MQIAPQFLCHGRGARRDHSSHQSHPALLPGGVDEGFPAHHPCCYSCLTARKKGKQELGYEALRGLRRILLRTRENLLHRGGNAAALQSEQIRPDARTAGQAFYPPSRCVQINSFCNQFVLCKSK